MTLNDDNISLHLRTEGSPWTPSTGSSRRLRDRDCASRVAGVSATPRGRHAPRGVSGRGAHPAAAVPRGRRRLRRRRPGIADAAAASIELLHCASLVHDDLPCFDDAATRRGRPSVHRAFGEPPGGARRRRADRARVPDAGARRRDAPQRLAPLVLTIVARAVGMPGGIVAGQAWECEPHVDLAALPPRQDRRAVRRRRRWRARRRRAPDREPWRTLGERLGEAYQVADDIRDAVGRPRRDRQADRPRCGPRPAERRDRTRSRRRGPPARSTSSAKRSRPYRACRGAADLRALILLEAKRLLPKTLARTRRDAPSRASAGSALAMITRVSQSSWLDRCFAAARSPAADARASSAGPPLSRSPGESHGAGPRAVRPVRGLRLLAGAAGLRASLACSRSCSKRPQTAARLARAAGASDAGRAAPARRRGIAAARRARAVRTATASAPSAPRCSAIRRRRDGRAPRAALRRPADPVALLRGDATRTALGALLALCGARRPDARQPRSSVAAITPR